jgi:hypothetical protein
MDHGAQRKLLRMVSALHLRGYQRLRIAPCMAPNGMSWRCSVAPVSNISRDHGALLVDWDGPAAHYTSGMEEEYFDWQDAAGATPGQLAELFIRRFPDIAAAGRGSDWVYAGWYLDMLHLTYPDRLPVAFGDYDPPGDCLTTVGGSPDVRVPLPPVGVGGASRRSPTG